MARCEDQEEKLASRDQLLRLSQPLPPVDSSISGSLRFSAISHSLGDKIIKTSKYVAFRTKRQLL